jgi:hypothetical protein
MDYIMLSGSCNVNIGLGRMGTEVAVVWFWCHPCVHLEVLRTATKRPVRIANPYAKNEIMKLLV